jgi:hypothetical protein
MKAENKERVFGEQKRLYYCFDGKEWNCNWEEKLEVSAFVHANVLQESEQIRQQIHDGKVSPLAYYIHKCFSSNTSFLSGRVASINLLSSYTGIAKQHIKQHLKPKYFCQLDESTLKKYAEAFDISIEELVNIVR